jgi:hypothetical protein
LNKVAVVIVIQTYTYESFSRLANNILVPGVFSDGFRTIVFPAVTQSGIIQSGIIAGKLKAQIPEQRRRRDEY